MKASILLDLTPQIVYYYKCQEGIRKAHKMTREKLINCGESVKHLTQRSPSDKMVNVRGKQKVFQEKKEGSIMAEKKMTRAEAIQFAIDNLTDGIYNDDFSEDDPVDEVIAILKKMHAQLTKPREKSETKSKARILNESLADKCVAAMDGHEAVTSKWLQEHVNGLLTPQKTTAVMKIAVEDGRVVKSREGKAVVYSLAK